MRKPLRTALVWLLMLALPIQAMAAFGMQLCQQVHGTGAFHDHRAQHAAMDAEHPKSAMHHPASASSCSLCAFCVSAVVINQPFAHAEPMHRAQPPLALSERFVSIVPEAPERPPRLSFV